MFFAFTICGTRSGVNKILSSTTFSGAKRQIKLRFADFGSRLKYNCDAVIRTARESGAILAGRCARNDQAGKIIGLPDHVKGTIIGEL